MREIFVSYEIFALLSHYLENTIKNSQQISLCQNSNGTQFLADAEILFTTVSTRDGSSPMSNENL
jgi:hypothetical protein